MKSIERRFEMFRAKDSNVGDYIILARASKNQRFSKDMISRWFNKLVPKDDYDSADKKSLIESLAKLSERSEENGF